MPGQSLAELIAQSDGSNGPRFPPPQKVKFGGIDPLGLRQTNFDLMDLIFPGVNNVARHIRPFTLVTWAWRRAGVVAANQGKREIPIDLVEDFVARIEVLYVWSQFLRNRDAQLPGRDVFAPLLRSERYAFDGEEWEQRKDTRSSSTALSAPINYGPALKTLGWLIPHEKQQGVLMPNVKASEALDSFEALIAASLKHPAFNNFGPLTVAKADVASWSDAWALENVTLAEQAFMKAALSGQNAPAARRRGIILVEGTHKRIPDGSATELRRIMCDSSSNIPLTEDELQTSGIWKQVQVRQLFRFALEAMLYWLRRVLEDGPKSTAELVQLFLGSCDSPPNLATSAEWLAVRTQSLGPVELIENLRGALRDLSAGNLEASIADALALALREKDADIKFAEREDRLPLVRARKDTATFAGKSPTEFIRHVLEAWILAQHVYWSVGRGLADARARGKSILRLKVVLEEGGWCLTPGARVGSPPAPAGDRLETIFSLATESGIMQKSDH